MAAKDPRQLISELTETELKVMQLYCKGIEQNDIAAKLFISPGTVRTHMSSIRSKLGVNKSWKIKEQFCKFLDTGSIPPIQAENAGVNSAQKTQPYPEPVTPNPGYIRDANSFPAKKDRTKGLLGCLIGTVIGVILVCILFTVGVWVLRDVIWPSTQGETPTTESIGEKTIREVTVVVTNTPEPLQPSSTAEEAQVTDEVVETKEVIVDVTATPTPEPSITPMPTDTPSPAPTPTALIIKEPVVEIGEGLDVNGIKVVVDVDIKPSGYLELLVNVTNNSASDNLIFNWTPEETFKLYDNTGYVYPVLYANQGRNEKIEPGETKLLGDSHLWWTARWESERIFDVGVTDFYIEVTDLSKLPRATWHMKVK